MTTDFFSFTLQNIYKNPARMAVEVGEGEEDLPQITLQEMLDDLQISEPDPGAGASILVQE